MYYSSHSKHPSFSSTLLDAIYRSIGDDETCGETRRKHNMVEATANGLLIQMIRKDDQETNFDHRVSRKVAVREENYMISSSWDSSCASFDRGDTFYGKRLKPIRVWGKKLINLHEKNSPALGLEKVKQPISPGAARLAGFLNSLLFKKPKRINNPDIHSPISNSADSSTCSSASSFSRSCLSKTPSCRGKPNGGEKRSVRFSPVSVILNQKHSQSCGNKLSSPKAAQNKNQKPETAVKNTTFSASNYIDEQMLLPAKEMNQKVEEAARDLLRNYQKKMDCEFPFGFRKSQNCNQGLDEESEEDDDAASYASSDLFELEDLSAIGMERYELPVYETTRPVVFP